MNWIKRKDQLPKGNEQVLTYSPCYSKKNDPHGRGPYRVMKAGYVRISSDVSHWTYPTLPIED